MDSRDPTTFAEVFVENLVSGLVEEWENEISRWDTEIRLSCRVFSKMQLRKTLNYSKIRKLIFGLRSLTPACPCAVIR